MGKMIFIHMLLGGLGGLAIVIGLILLVALLAGSAVSTAGVVALIAGGALAVAIDGYLLVTQFSKAGKTLFG